MEDVLLAEVIQQHVLVYFFIIEDELRSNLNRGYFVFFEESQSCENILGKFFYFRNILRKKQLAV